jgi:type IV secretion system protein VirB10
MKSKRKLIVLIVVWYLALLLPGPLRYGRAQDDVSVPDNTLFRLELLSPISTATNQKGDQFNCRGLDTGELYGSIVSGHITKIKRSGKVKGKSEIALAFDSITLPDGRSGKFGAQVVEVYDVVGAGNEGQADEEGRVTGKSLRKRDAVTISVATAVGALIGGLIGGAQGAAIGAAAGAALGVTTTLATKGPDLEFKAGTQFTVRTGTRTHQTR